MQHQTCKPALNAKWILTVLGVLLASLLLIFHQALPNGLTTNTINLWSPKSSTTNTPEDTEDSSKSPAVIPNTVHFVHLVKPSSPTFEFPFRQFLAIYAAWHYLHPDNIYIHTNVEEHLIEETLRKSTSPWTKAASRLPGVKFNHQTPPDHTKSGVPIDKLPNQSDFVRTGVLEKFGGIYLDTDSHVLRDLDPLRRTGFENVVGQQANAQICPAVILAAPGNKMMEAYHILQHTAFNPNRWALHATDLLTTLAREFQIPDRQVLILPHNTFFPFDWVSAELKKLYQVHDDLGVPAVNNKGISNLTEFVDNFQLYGPETWQKDWRSSYVLHGWNSGIEKHLNDQEVKEMFGKFGGITPQYVLARNSHFATAVYPAMKHALDNGALDGIEYDQSQP